MAIRTCDGDFTRFKRLPQAAEKVALKFRQFVEEQDPEMRQADLAGTDA